VTVIAEFDRNLEKYAEVLVKVGLNLQPGQRLVIGAPFFGIDGAPLEAYPLIRKIAKTAYQAGAKYVAVNWDDEELQRIRVQDAGLDSMSEVAAWKNEVAIKYIDNRDAIMVISAQNPDLMGGLKAQKVQAKQMAEAKQLHKVFSRLFAGATNWLIAGASIGSWARKVFPDLSQDEAKARLWNAIFEACRINQDDPVTGWKRHLAELDKRAAYLNGKRYATLKYKGLGTDLTIGLPQGHIWHGGSGTAQNGVTFVPNIPTEEVYTIPHKDRIDGVVTATKPLSYGGSLIENFTLKFFGGRVVHATAESGEDALNNLLNTDEGSRSLGEVSLVPHSSPISQSGLLFYNILFDENASNHIALGDALRLIEGAENMTPEEFAAAGGNQSVTHADFMIGSGEMDVDGITVEGTAEPVTRRGEWAFRV
jgi:aminopeptidase